VTAAPRVLPIAFPPVNGETIGSYLNRLADANRLKIGTLTDTLGLHRRCRRDDDPTGWSQDTLARLAALTDRSATALAHGLPALNSLLTGKAHAMPATTHENLAAPRRPACRPCMARHGASLVIRSAPHSDCVCRRHQRWLHSLDQHELALLPEVLKANTRHRRLDRATSKLLSGGLAHIQAQQQIRTWFAAGSHPELHQRWLQRLANLGEDLYGDPHRPTIERIDIATYPETVVLTTLFASPHWKEHDDLYIEAGRRLGVRPFVSSVSG
jgi:hypothetical protein